MLSFHNDKKVKAKYVNRVVAHRKADNIIRGIGWTGIKGCAVGCTLEKYDHKAYETELGIPEWLARVEDTLFERMSLKKYNIWPELFLKAIPIGVDLDKIKSKFIIIVLKRALKQFDRKKFPEVKKAIDRVIELYKAKKIDLKEMKKTRAAADAAVYAAYAAYAAADAGADAAVYAAYAAYAAADAGADAAADAAVYAADAAAYAADAADVRTKTHDYFANELLKLLKKVK